MSSAVNFEVQLKDLLLADEGVAAIVGHKIFPLVIPQGTKLPCVSFQRISGMPANTLLGASGLEKINIEIDAWAKNYADAKDLAIAIRAAMPAQGAWGAHLDADQDIYDSDTKYYRVIMEYTVWFCEE